MTTVDTRFEICNNPIEFIQAVCEEIGSVAREWKNGYDNIIREVIDASKETSPPEVARAIEKVLLNLPEIVAVLSIFSNTAPLLGGVYLGGRMVSIIVPIVVNAVDQNRDITDQDVKLITDQLHGCLTPALYVSANVASVYYFVRGIVTLDYVLILQSFLYGTAGSVMMNKMMDASPYGAIRNFLTVEN